MTLLELVKDLRIRLDDFGGYSASDSDWESDDSDCLWSNEELTRYLNKAEEEYCRRVPIIDSSTPSICSISIVAGTANYTISPLILSVDRVKLASQTKPLAKTSSEELDLLLDNWEAESDEPEMFIDDLNPYSIRLVGVPVSNDVASLKVSRLPLNEMAWDNSDTDEPEIRPEEHFTLLDWAAALAYLKQDAETLDKNKSDMFMNDFNTKVRARPNSKEIDLQRQRAARNLRVRSYYR